MKEVRVRLTKHDLTIDLQILIIVTLQIFDLSIITEQNIFHL